VHVSPQPLPAAVGKRTRASSADVGAQPQPLPARALPLTLWEEHLLPLLTCKDAGRFGCTCTALRRLVREHFRDFYTPLHHLRAALTTFPRARTVKLRDLYRYTDVQALVQCLREGGRGRGVSRVSHPRSENHVTRDFLHAALQAGALPSLKNVSARLESPIHRASLTEGLVAAMHELRLSIICGGDGEAGVEPQLAALGLVRQLPALAKLELEVKAISDDHPPVRWPPFTPPTVRALRIEYGASSGHVTQPLLRALPGTLGVSGARLERLEFIFPSSFEDIGNGLVHLAQVLRCCSPTLRGFSLAKWRFEGIQAQQDGDYAIQVEQLRVQWADVLAGVSACRELQVLVLPNISIEPLFPRGTFFGKLVHLEICDHEREHPPDAGVIGLWELMASGGLPALAKLNVRLEGRWGLVEVRFRMAPAFEAVAGTLTHLWIVKLYDGGWSRDEVGYELGVAVGKLRRLKELALNISEDGRVYPALAQGLTASVGGVPLPLLWRILSSKYSRSMPTCW
jgi:hypothetical protein